MRAFRRWGFQYRHASRIPISYGVLSAHTCAPTLRARISPRSDLHSCIRRGCHSSEATRRICTQLQRQRHSLVGLCSCVFDEDRVLSLSDKVEQCFRANPVPGPCKPICDCDDCTSDLVLEIFQRIRWLRKNSQFALHGQRDICCRSDHVEMMD